VFRQRWGFALHHGPDPDRKVSRARAVRNDGCAGQKH
jgi:hypothetical protein